MKKRRHKSTPAPKSPRPGPVETLPRTISAEELCSLTGLTDRRHRQLAEEGHFPPPIEARYQTESTIRGVINYLRHGAKEKTGKLAEAKLLREESKARKDKVEADLAEGLAVPVAVARRVFTRICYEVKSRLLGIPSSVAPRLVGCDVIESESKIKSEIEDALRGLSRHEWNQEKPAPAGGKADHGAHPTESRPGPDPAPRG